MQARQSLAAGAWQLLLRTFRVLHALLASAQLRLINLTLAAWQPGQERSVLVAYETIIFLGGFGGVAPLAALAVPPSKRLYLSRFYCLL